MALCVADLFLDDGVCRLMVPGLGGDDGLALFSTPIINAPYPVPSRPGSIIISSSLAKAKLIVMKYKVVRK